MRVASLLTFISFATVQNLRGSQRYAWLCVCCKDWDRDRTSIYQILEDRSRMTQDRDALYRNDIRLPRTGAALFFSGHRVGIDQSVR
jgi:hypothetical protein